MSVKNVLFQHLPELLQTRAFRQTGLDTNPLGYARTSIACAVCPRRDRDYACATPQIHLMPALKQKPQGLAGLSTRPRRPTQAGGSHRHSSHAPLAERQRHCTHCWAEKAHQRLVDLFLYNPKPGSTSRTGGRPGPTNHPQLWQRRRDTLSGIFWMLVTRSTSPSGTPVLGWRPSNNFLSRYRLAGVASSGQGEDKETTRCAP